MVSASIDLSAVQCIVFKIKGRLCACHAKDTADIVMSYYNRCNIRLCLIRARNRSVLVQAYQTADIISIDLPYVGYPRENSVIIVKHL